MDGIKQVQDTLGPWWAYFEYCFNLNPLSTVCGPFWERIIMGAVVVGFIAAGYGLLKYHAYRRQERRARIAQWESEQADEAGIREAIWNGDKAYRTELGDEEVARQIRAALADRKSQNSAPAP